MNSLSRTLAKTTADENVESLDFDWYAHTGVKSPVVSLSLIDVLDQSKPAARFITCVATGRGIKTVQALSKETKVQIWDIERICAIAAVEEHKNYLNQHIKLAAFFKFPLKHWLACIEGKHSDRTIKSFLSGVFPVERVEEIPVAGLNTFIEQLMKAHGIDSLRQLQMQLGCDQEALEIVCMERTSKTAKADEFEQIQTELAHFFGLSLMFFQRGIQEKLGAKILRTTLMTAYKKRLGMADGVRAYCEDQRSLFGSEVVKDFKPRWGVS
jgi:hypothetical protein